MNKEKLQKRSQEYYRNLSEDKKLKKGTHANNINKSMTDEYRERKKGYLKKYYHKRKDLLNHLISHVEENVNLNK